MREIKFRAWDKVQNKMLSWENLCNQISNLLSRINGDSNWIYQQYTGLKDKNGKEIYEGDIVKGELETKTNSYPMTGIVFYDHSGFRLKVIQEKSAKQADRNGNHNYFDFVNDKGDIFQEMEVIGNIYQNPELNTGANF